MIPTIRPRLLLALLVAAAAALAGCTGGGGEEATGGNGGEGGDGTMDRGDDPNWAPDGIEAPNPYAGGGASPGGGNDTETNASSPTTADS